MNDYYQTLIESKLEPVGESGDNVIYRCPQCERHTGSGHLYVNYKKNVYNCFKCSLSGRDIRTLLYHIGYTRESIREAPIDLIVSISSRIKNPLDEVSEMLRVNDEEIRDYSTDLDILTEYWRYHVKPLSQQAMVYLYNRGITDEMIHDYCIGEGINNRGMSLGKRSFYGRDYSGRIMIPSIHKMDNKVSFYVARDYLGRNNVAKYLNPPQDLAYSSEDVWNLYNLSTNRDMLIICEGVFTSMSVCALGYDSIATYGKSISERSNSRGKCIIKSQGDKILESGYDRYVIAYDADAKDSMISTCEYLRVRGATVYYIDVPDKYGPHTDLSDFNPIDRRYLINSMRIYDQSARLSLSCHL